MSLWTGEIWTQMHTGGHHVKMKAEVKVMSYKARKASQRPSKLSEAQERHGTGSPPSSWKDPTLVTPWSWTSSLQKHETISVWVSVVYITQSGVLRCNSHRKLIQTPIQTGVHLFPEVSKHICWSGKESNANKDGRRRVLIVLPCLK